MTTPVGSTTNTPAASAANNPLASLTSNFDTFLTLLTTQLKNQDPLSPLDSNQFTQQLTQMSGVEAQLQGNNLLQSLVNNTGSNVSSAVGLIGKNVTATSDTANLSNGAANWTYNLGSAASDLKVEVQDATGSTVYATAPSDMSAGDHTFTWNGKGLDGSKLPDGAYTLKVTADDNTGAAVTTTSSITGTATSVQQVSGQTLLTVNGVQVSLSNITSVNAGS